jgi:amidophosphoribosyltransferase
MEKSKEKQNPMEFVEKVRHSCGIFGISGTGEISSLVYYGLYALQHRGQEAAGISTWDEGKLSSIYGTGLIKDAFGAKKLSRLKGNVGVGHVRYSTAGTKGVRNVQPVKASLKGKKVVLAHNGEIVNATQLRRSLKREGIKLKGDSDSEVIALLLANELTHSNNFEDAMKQVMEQLRGAYSLVILVDGELFAVRDPNGIRPLCIGEAEESQVVASESVALDITGAKLIRDVRVGEIIKITPKKVETLTQLPASPSYCMFEFVYFARGDSLIQGREIHRVREEIGKSLAKEHGVEADIVVPIPDSGRSHALGYAMESGIPYQEGLMKNRYIPRTFIMPSQAQRNLNVRLKLNPVKGVIKGKRLVLIDDSIVRGTTIGWIVHMLKKEGAKEVHVRIASPPIRAPCYFGIDMKTKKQLAAVNKSIKEISLSIGADSLGYSSIDGLVKSIGLPKESLCLGCLTGKYPIKGGREA